MPIPIRRSAAYAAGFFLLLWPARSSAGRLQMLSYNAAGIPFVQPHSRERLDRLAGLLSDSPYDLVALQEVWFEGAARRLHRLSGFPFAARQRLI